MSRRQVLRQMSTSSRSTDLKSVLASKISHHQREVSALLREHRHTTIQQLTVNTVYGGMRGLNALVCETSVLDEREGIRLRGLSIAECHRLLPKVEGGTQPLPEAVWWLLCTGDVPNQQQTRAISLEWAQRSGVPGHVLELLGQLPSHMHPMAQLVSALAALSSESLAASAPHRPGLLHWECVYEDAMNLLAKLPVVAGIIYRNLYRASSVLSGGIPAGEVDSSNDWAKNLASVLGYSDKLFTELLRLYLFLHCDHEGGNVSAHTCQLVGSGLTDPFLALSAAMAGLAGPLHGQASEEVLTFLKKIMRDLGENYTKEELTVWCQRYVNRGQLIPGYGHAVLKVTDPRFTCEREFAARHLRADRMVRLVDDLYQTVPDVLQQHTRTRNPWPNVDAHSGVLLQHFGMTETAFYTVLVGVSRALGCMAQTIWCRAMRLPTERPRSLTTEGWKRMT